MKPIHEHLEEDLKKWPSRPYIYTKVDGVYHPRTFREVIADVQNLSRALLARGLRGKNLMICSENSYEWIALYFAVMSYVGTCVPVDKESTSHDLRNIIRALPVAVVFYSRAKSAQVEPLRNAHPEISWLCIEDAFPALIREGKALETPLRGEDNLQQTVLILFTSGTTNLPKAIPLTQENLLANWETLYRRTPMTETDTSCVFLPLHHVYTGVANVLYTVISGMQLYLCTDLSRMARELLEVRPTVVCMVPLLLYRIREAMTDELLDALRGVRFLYCGGSFTDPAVKEYFIRQGVPLMEAYGTTETSSVIALAVPGDPELRSNGVIFENLEVWIEDPDEDGVGEIVVKGKSVSRGYLNRSDRYSEFDAQGAYHTGDLGRLDEQRRLYLKGRKKRMILTANGKNIYVDELEALLLSDPRIRTAKVFEEDRHPAASVVTDLSEAEVKLLIDQINQKLPRFKQIRNFYTKPDTLGGRIK